MKVFLSLLVCVATLTHADSQSFNNYQAPQSRNGGGGGSSYAGNGGRNGGGGGGGGSSYGGNGGNGGNGGGNGEPASYNFQYDVNDEASGNNFGHQESRDGPRAEGTYYVQLPDSRIMTVEYYADETGYHPTITFEGEAQFPEDQSSGSQYPEAQASRQPSNSYQQPPQQSPPSQQYGQPFGK